MGDGRAAAATRDAAGLVLLTPDGTTTGDKISMSDAATVRNHSVTAFV